MMKKIFAMALCAMLLLPLTVSAAAEAADAADAVFDCWTVDGSSVCCFAVPGEGADVSVTAAGAPVAQTSMTTVEQAGLPVTYICMIDQSSAYSLLQRESQQQGIQALGDRERKVILLRYYRGMTQESCARVLGVSQVQISRIGKRAIDRLRTLLA